MINRLVYYISSIPTIIFGFKNWWQLPMLLLGKRPFTLHLNNGLQFNIRSLMDAWIIKETCLDRDYERLGTPLQNHWTVLDIGAGLGDFSIYAANMHPQSRVIGFEPFPESFDLLKENLALNNVMNVTAVPVAVGKENGQTQLATTGAAVQHSTSMDSATTALDTLIDVETKTLQSLFDEYGIQTCDFLKLDCEGGEFDILLNCHEETLSRIHYIAMEYHNHVTDMTHHDLEVFLKSKGFIVQTIPNPVHDYLGFLFAINQSS